MLSTNDNAEVSNEKRKPRPIVQAATFVLAGPIVGFLCAWLDFSVCVVATSPRNSDGGLVFAPFFAGPFGAMIGLVVMLFVAWSLRKEELYPTLRYLTKGTLLFALPCACIPEWGAIISIVAAIVGFWAAYIRLKVRNFTKEDWRRFVFGESGYGW